MLEKNEILEEELDCSLCECDLLLFCQLVIHCNHCHLDYCGDCWPKKTFCPRCFPIPKR